MMEANLGRALNQSEGNWGIFISPAHPVSLGFVIVAVLWIVVPLLMKLRGKSVLVNDEG